MRPLLVDWFLLQAPEYLVALPRQCRSGGRAARVADSCLGQFSQALELWFGLFFVEVETLFSGWVRCSVVALQEYRNGVRAVHVADLRLRFEWIAGAVFANSQRAFGKSRFVA